MKYAGNYFVKGDYLDLEKGLKRLTLVLSILAGTCVVIYLAATIEIIAIIVFLLVFLFHEVISYYAVRYVFGFIRWVFKRFYTDKSKDEKDNNQLVTPGGNHNYL
jgi:hypothetical protein